MTIDYDAEQMSNWSGMPRLFLRYRGTILAGAFTGPMFWLPNLLHIFFCIIGGQIVPLGASNAADADFTAADASADWSGGVALSSNKLQLSWSVALVTLPLLFFFIVFYNNNSYSRFYTLYGHTVGLGANVMEWTALVKQYR